MCKPPIILVGSGGHSRACIDVIEAEARFRIAGLIGLPSEVGSENLGYPVLGTDEDLPNLTKKVKSAIVTVGQIESPQSRVRIYQRLRELGCDLPIIVAPDAHVSHHAELAEGTIIMHGALVNAGARIGRNCIINSRALIEHDVLVSDHCHVSTGVTINGGAAVGEGTFIGSGSMVREGIRIGSACVVGMGQRVLSDCEDGAWLRHGKGML